MLAARREHTGSERRRTMPITALVTLPMAARLVAVRRARPTPYDVQRSPAKAIEGDDLDDPEIGLIVVGKLAGMTRP